MERGEATAPTRGRSATARELWEAFLSNCDYGLDFHTSTRNRTTMSHLRVDVATPEVERLARAFGANVVLAERGLVDGTTEEPKWFRVVHGGAGDRA